MIEPGQIWIAEASEATENRVCMVRIVDIHQGQAIYRYWLADYPHIPLRIRTTSEEIRDVREVERWIQFTQAQLISEEKQQALLSLWGHQ